MIQEDDTYVKGSLRSTSILGTHSLPYSQQPDDSIPILSNGSIRPFIMPQDVGCSLFYRTRLFIRAWLCDSVA